MIELTYFEMGNFIPKVIHQTCPFKDRLPIEIKKNIRKIRQLNENWEYRLYDDADIETFILEHYDLEIFHVYQRINFCYGAVRADFFRYLLMYAKGGLYLDIKSSVSRPLDDVVDITDRYILSKWKDRPWGMHRELASFSGGEYQQWHIIAVAGHPFLREVIERVVGNIKQYNMLADGIGRPGVMRISGPIAYTLAIENMKSLHSFREVDIGQDFGFEYSIYEVSAQQGKHKSLFRKHYSVLRAPIINSNAFKDYSLMALYYMRKITKRIARKVLPGYFIS